MKIYTVTWEVSDDTYTIAGVFSSHDEAHECAMEALEEGWDADLEEWEVPLPEQNDKNTIILRETPMVEFTCRNCDTVFKTRLWHRTKNVRYNSFCPCCYRATRKN